MVGVISISRYPNISGPLSDRGPVDRCFYRGIKMENPTSQLTVRTVPLRTLQRWDWDRTGHEVKLLGLIVFLGNVPAEELWLAVELYDSRRSPLAAAAVQLNSHDLEGWGVATIETLLEVAAEPPYRLRVRYLEKNIPLLAEQELGSGPLDVKPWNHRQLGAGTLTDRMLTSKKTDFRPWKYIEQQ